MNCEEYLHSLELFGIKLGLVQTAELMSRAGYCAAKEKKPYFIHLAGSNGKGSTGAMIQKALTAAGMKTGFYTSPHLAAFNERMRIDGEMISDAELEAEFQKLMPVAEDMKKDGKFVTYFEFTTILALGYFIHNDVDFVIWETGMGGRFDSTNVIETEAAVITNIAMEHCQYLGDTLAKIAYEKGGIIKENTPVFCGIMEDEALDVLQNIAAEKNAPFCAVREEFKLLGRAGGKQILQTPFGEAKLALAGDMQRKNYTLACQVLKYLSDKFSLDMQKMIDSAADVSWPGRFQFIEDGSILDGGHNPDGTAALAECLKEFCPGEKFCFVFASFEDKDTEECLKNLLPLAQEFCFMPLSYTGRPSCSGERLKELVNKIAPEFEAISLFSSLEEFLNRSSATTARKVFCGSLYLLGEYFQHTDLLMLKKI